MKIALLGPASSIHLQRWAAALVGKGHAVHVISQHYDEPFATMAGLASTTWLPHRGTAGYLLNARALGQVIAKLLPDVLNTHYASGYGLTASTIWSVPTLLSVWGSDVYDFPYESWLKGRLIRWNLRRATRVASTSRIMACQVAKLVPELEPAFVTPFGVDCKRFGPAAQRDARYLSIGTVKTMAAKYGIDLLLRAFASLLDDPAIQTADVGGRLRLMLVGGGVERDALESLAKRLGIHARVEFVGQVGHDEVASWLNRFDIYVAASRLDSESFGVAAIEASACGVPVVVSDAGGLPEVVKDGVTGIVVPRENVPALAAALKRLVLDETLRRAMGEAGRRWVLDHYEWNSCVDVMLACYEQVIASKRV